MVQDSGEHKRYANRLIGYIPVEGRVQLVTAFSTKYMQRWISGEIGFLSRSREGIKTPTLYQFYGCDARDRECSTHAAETPTDTSKHPPITYRGKYESYYQIPSIPRH